MIKINLITIHTQLLKMIGLIWHISCKRVQNKKNKSHMKLFKIKKKKHQLTVKREEKNK